MNHFVPWQYVAHDEVWNLHPTTRNINSSKSNQLPDWNQYFDKLGEMEYKAYVMRTKCDAVSKEFERCTRHHLNNQEIRNQLYEDDLSALQFNEHLEHVIRPIYESAKNCGFREWHYDG